MKITTDRQPYVQPLAAPLHQLIGSDHFGILDIETMGLSSKFHPIILIGLLWIEDNQVVIRQYFAEGPGDEKALLEAFGADVKNLSFIFTYNGASFDLPFLKERFKKHGLPCFFESCYHFDLLQFIRKYKQTLCLTNYQLKTVEKFLGIARRDTISGKESVELYREYTKNPSAALEKTILLHNYEDILYLLPVTHIVAHFPPSFSLWAEGFTKLQLGDNSVYFSYYPEDISFNRNRLQVQGKTNKVPHLKEQIHFTPQFDFQWLPQEGSFTLSLELTPLTLASDETAHCIDLSDLPLKTTDYKSVIYLPDLVYDNLLMIGRATIEEERSLIQFIKFFIKDLLEKNI